LISRSPVRSPALKPLNRRAVCCMGSVHLLKNDVYVNQTYFRASAVNLYYIVTILNCSHVQRLLKMIKNLKNNCDWKSRCYGIIFNDDVSGEPLPCDIYHTKITCEGGVAIINCSESMSIFIIDGFYGRKEKDVW